MKKFAATLAGTFMIAGSALLLAQDPVKVDPTHYKTVLDNAAVRVLKVDYAPGTKSPMHSHPGAIVISLAASKVQFTMPDKTTQDSDMANETGMYTPAGSHSSSAGSTGANALVVELKGAAGKATLPASRPGMTIKVLAEGPRGMAYRSTAAADFAEPAGTKHDYDQLVIALGPAQMSLSIDGKPAKTTWARGDVQFIGRGTPHESKNNSGKPVEFIIVAIK
jgi:quercetin dioxygenase-like cupin family protein